MNFQTGLMSPSAAEAAINHDCSAITDITGYGLVGHALEMAEASNVTVRLDSGSLPQLPETLELAAKGQLTGGGRDNRNFCEPKTTYESKLAEPLIDLLHDPQTSGGLLLAVAAADAESLLRELQVTCPEAAIVGEIISGEPRILLS